MTRPVIIFTHGAWHTPECYNKIIPRLQSHGYRCIALQLPGSGSVPPVTSLDEDIALIRSTVQGEIDAGEEILFVTHSWGGVPTSAGLEGLGKKEREQAGQKGGVVKIVYLASFVLPAGYSLSDGAGPEPVEWWKTEGDVAIVTDASGLYHDLDPEEAREYASLLKPHSMATFKGTVKGAPWMTIPSIYLIAEQDRIVPPNAQEAMALNCQKAGAPMQIERVDASHSMFLSKPDFTVELLRRAAGENPV